MKQPPSAAEGAAAAGHKKGKKDTRMSKTTAVTFASEKPKSGKGNGKAVTEAIPAVDEETGVDKNPRPVKRGYKQAANSGLKTPPAPTANEANEADADAASSPPTSPVVPMGPMPAPPCDDGLWDAIRMGIHTTMSRNLEEKIGQLQADWEAAEGAFQASRDAMEVAVKSAQAVKEGVELWKEMWLNDQ
ncbi:hypothetical protein N7520_011399 [Penicillium odoratum]|uniref:uncharacterized protein n=1 Tax=Penicillium odoratum TaxID=1167516 RepID=UPI00254662CC|nr:uncharacterized protein N7520_011399 [Penicillium odoratum]KAJ5746217.1 hypothetical protein N7520_011399 [Penicillium odoratum]